MPHGLHIHPFQTVTLFFLTHFAPESGIQAGGWGVTGAAVAPRWQKGGRSLPSQSGVPWPQTAVITFLCCPDTGCFPCKSTPLGENPNGFERFCNSSLQEDAPGPCFSFSTKPHVSQLARSWQPREHGQTVQNVSQLGEDSSAAGCSSTGSVRLCLDGGGFCIT